MKKGFILGTAFGMVIGAATMAFAANSYIQAVLNQGIKVSLDGEVQEFRDETTNEIQYPLTYHDRTYLPLRTVANLVGVEVDYDANTNTAILMTSEYVEISKDESKVNEVPSWVESALYSTFINSLGNVRNRLSTAEVLVRGQEAANGIARSYSQCLNFVARGGYALEGEEREKMWLSRKDAEEIRYTKIEDNALNNDEIGGSLFSPLSHLPEIEILSDDGEIIKKHVSYYVTSNGDLFIWPPYEYQNEFYVNAETKVTKTDGTTIKADNRADVTNMLKDGFTFKVGNIDVTM